jgi:hypothetical protein
VCWGWSWERTQYMGRLVRDWEVRSLRLKRKCTTLAKGPNSHVLWLCDFYMAYTLLWKGWYAKFYTKGLFVTARNWKCTPVFSHWGWLNELG